uniref:Uncharacterized protein n=1 Tax=Caenorhabditis japonica TaxID=281687 RepID=A0A8R1IIR1_CAEJA
MLREACEKAVSGRQVGTPREKLSNVEDSELTVENGHVGVKRRRKLRKNFARFVDTVDEVEEQVMEKLISVQRCTVRQRGIIVGPIEEFRKELSARFEDIGREMRLRAVLRLMREQKLKEKRPVQRVDTAKKARKAMMIEPVEILQSL